MKVLSRDFTTAEKLLILVLGLVLVALAYYQFVDKPVRRDIAAAQAEKENLEIELAVVQGKIATLTKMQEELDSLMESESLSIMPSYNNMQAELKLLNDLLSNTLDYSVNFNNVTRDGNQIRRNFTLQFTVSDYRTMERILQRLSENEFRCLIGDVSCSYSTYRYYTNGIERIREEYKPAYTVNATATFYETMVGGTPDAGLPVNERAAS